MNEIFYHDKSLLLGPQNQFTLRCGTKPSFGFFLAPKSLVDYVLTIQSGVAGDLVFTDGVTTVTLHKIYLVKATSLPTLEQEVFEIVLADERILWQYKYGTRDYNTYQKDRTKGTDDFDLKNLKTPEGEEDRPWTFKEVVAELETVLGVTKLEMDGDSYPNPNEETTPSIPERAPRNIIAKNVTGACALQQLLNELGAFVAPSFSGGDVNYTIYPVGAAEVEDTPDPDYDGSPYDDTTVITANANRLHKEKVIRINPVVQKGGTIKMLASADDDETEARYLSYGSKSAGGSGALLLPSSFAVFGPESNSDALGDIGDELAQEYIDSFQNTWRDNVYAGVIAFTLNRAVHEITFTLNAQGAFTRIRSFRPREGTDRIRDELFAYHRYLIGAGGTTALWAKVIRGLQYADPVGDPSEGYDKYLVRLLASSVQAWQSGVEYAEGALVSHNDLVYEALVEHTSVPEDNVPPNCPSGTTEDNDFWQFATEIEVSGIAMEGNYSTIDLRDWGRWFIADDIFPVVKRGGTWYIWQTLIPLRRRQTESATVGSLSWIAAENRLAAVYR